MRVVIVAIVLLLAWPLGAAAQASEHYRSQGYLFCAPGVASSGMNLGSAFVHFGGGGDGFVYKGLGLGAEVGYMALWSRFSDGSGVGFANASYHFRHRARPGHIEPFITGGYTLFFRAGTTWTVNFGGGINYWLARQAAVRFEARCPGVATEGRFGGPDPVVEFRIGVTWR